jgi:hypothetical protein
LPCLPNLLPFATEIGSPPSADAHPFTLAPGISQAQFAREIMIHVANFAPDHVFVHAGVVAWNDRALLLPGPSFAGKTTLTAALVRAGATYYSDEYAVVDEDGAIHPYPRDLQMREPGTTSQTSLPVASLCGKAGALPLRAATIFFTRYRPGARWDPQPVTHGMALLEMLRHTIPVQRTPARVMATLSRMLEGTTAWASDRDDAHSTAKLLLATFQQEETEQREMHQQPLDRRQIANETSHAGAGPV